MNAIKRFGWKRMLGIATIGLVAYIAWNYTHQIAIHIKALDVVWVTLLVIILAAIANIKFIMRKVRTISK